jgi:hypothetical protein
VIPQTKPVSPRLRVKSNRTHMEAVVGTWELCGEKIQMLVDAETATLVAVNSRGEPVNPIQVISRGFKR